MTVKELRAILFQITNEDAKIVLSSDSEGNSFALLDDLGQVDKGDKIVVLFPEHNSVQDVDELS